MGKRNPIVISSSDDGDCEPSSRLKRSYEMPKSRSSVTRTNPSRTKRPRLSSSRLSKQPSGVDEMRLAFEDFDEVLNGFKVSAGSRRSNLKELWVDKYKPRSMEELAVHKKKIEEVKLWFEERLRTPKGEVVGCVLLITGQAGIGKSATVHVVASHFGAQICEWNTPTPTIWKEHVHNLSAGINYTSKLDEFEIFVERVRKYGLISSSSDGKSKSIIMVIDDLPIINGRSAFERLQRCLVLLVRSTLVPTAILITDSGSSDSSDITVKWLEELQLSLESAGASKVSFNPITNNSIKKTLSRICRQEQCNVAAEDLDLIAKASSGDIRHAITSLQLFCLKPEVKLNLSVPNSTPGYPNKSTNEINAYCGGFSARYGRDETLTLFHALGKFLHNKRDTENVAASDPIAFHVGEKFSRLPFKMDSPEKVLCQAHGQSRPIADFLHENVLDFLSDEAVDDAWTVASYLGDADLLLASFRGMVARYSEIENVLQSAAASVAVRGVLYGNFHPLPPRWHAIRKPKLWQIEQSSRHNQDELLRQRFIASVRPGFSELSVIATEFRPVLKWLGYRTAGGNETQDSGDDSSQRMSIDDHESEVSDDDDIEDW